MLLKNLKRGITTEMKRGELKENQNDIITTLVLAAKGDKEIAKELVSFRQYKDTKYYVNGLGEVLEKVADKFYFVAQNEKERESYLRIKFDKSIKIDNEYKKQVNTHIAVANCFLKNTNSNYNQINHKNSLKYDNQLWNLEYCDNKKNSEHRDLMQNLKRSKADVMLYCDLDFENLVRAKEFEGEIFTPNQNGEVLLLLKANSRQSNKCLYLNLDKEFDKRVQELKEIYNISFAA